LFVILKFSVQGVANHGEHNTLKAIVARSFFVSSFH